MLLASSDHRCRCPALCLYLTCSRKGNLCRTWPFQGPKALWSKMASDIPQLSPQRSHRHLLHALSFFPPSSMGRPRARIAEGSQPQNDLVKGNTTRPLWSQSEMGLGWKLGPKMLDLCRLAGIRAHRCGVLDFAGSYSDPLTA